MDDLLQPRGTSCKGRSDAVRKALGEDLPSVGCCVAPEVSYDELELDAPATERQVGGTTLVAALDAMRRGLALWTGRHGGFRPHDQTDPVGADVEMIDDESSRY